MTQSGSEPQPQTESVPGDGDAAASESNPGSPVQLTSETEATEITNCDFADDVEEPIKSDS